MVTSPATSNRFFTAKGAPASGPGSSPPASAASTARASASARASVTAVKLLRAGLRTAIRAIDASATSTALSAPPRTAAAMLSASPSLTGEKYRRRLRLLGQRKRHDERRHLGDALDIEDDARAMGRIQRQSDQCRGGIDIGLGINGAVGQWLLLGVCGEPVG